jgi:hypothetical protein
MTLIGLFRLVNLENFGMHMKSWRPNFDNGCMVLIGLSGVSHRENLRKLMKVFILELAIVFV